MSSQDLADRLATMSRTDLIRTLKGMRCPFTIDFTDEFLRTVSLQRLRHIIVAASLHDQRRNKTSRRASRDATSRSSQRTMSRRRR